MTNQAPCPCCGQLRPYPTEPGEWEYCENHLYFRDVTFWQKATVKLPGIDDDDGQEGLRLWIDGEMRWWPNNAVWRKIE